MHIMGNIINFPYRDVKLTQNAKARILVMCLLHGGMCSKENLLHPIKIFLAENGNYNEFVELRLQRQTYVGREAEEKTIHLFYD